MQESFTYHIKLQDAVDEEAFNASSPLSVKVAQTDAETTTFIVHTDQSGLVGLIRHIHHQGFVLLSLLRK
ncbi:MAG: hypothetical protein JW730_04490 [Anaerolineales bacterium]|nr:hypothetical protein [Anaerolineales bacterium]